MKLTRKPTIKHFPEKRKPTSIVFHTDQGSERGTTSWILSGPKSVSYNYYITKKGRVVEFVPYQYAAFHSGVVHEPTNEAKKFFGNKNPNRVSVGICYEGKNVNATEDQVVATVELMRYLKNEGVKIKKTFAHVEITSYKPKQVLDFQKRVLKLYNEKSKVDNKDKEIEKRDNTRALSLLTMAEKILKEVKKDLK